MEPKKTEKADLTNKSFLFLSIGLVISLLISIMAFTYKTYDDVSVKDLSKNQSVVEEIMEVPPTDQLPPPPPKIQQPQIIEVPDEKKIEEEIDINMDTEDSEEKKVEEIKIVEQEVEKEDVDQIFSIVEEQATYKGGLASFYEFVGKKIKYPAQAKRMNIEGKVFVEFVIERDGRLTDVKAIKGIGGGCDEEAVRVVMSSPGWNPGKQRGKPVRTRFVIPINFRLQ